MVRRRRIFPTSRSWKEGSHSGSRWPSGSSPVVSAWSGSCPPWQSRYDRGPSSRICASGAPSRRRSVACLTMTMPSLGIAWRSASCAGADTAVRENANVAASERAVMESSSYRLAQSSSGRARLQLQLFQPGFQRPHPTTSALPSNGIERFASVRNTLNRSVVSVSQHFTVRLYRFWNRVVSTTEVFLKRHWHFQNLKLLGFPPGLFGTCGSALLNVM